MEEKIREQYYHQNYLESIDLCNQLNKVLPHSNTGYLYKGLNLIELKLYDEARENLEIARINVFKNKFKNWLQKDIHEISIGISRTYLGKRMIQEAIDEITRTIEQFPKSARGYLFKARMYWDDDDYIQAIEVLNDGLKNNKQDKDLIEYKNRLIYSYTENNRYQKK